MPRLKTKDQGPKTNIYMSVIRIASRYAKSLLDLATEQGKVDKVLEDMQTFNEAVAQRDFELVLKSPIIKSDKKQAIIKEIFGGQFDELTMMFLEVIVRKGREPYLAPISKEFLAQYKATQKVSSIRLTTATELAPASMETIKKQLLASAATDENVEIETVINPDLIGGFVIEFDDKLYDASVAHKLELLRKEFSVNQFEKKM